MKALILAGGFGTRLKDILGDMPKPMAMILGKPFLEHQIRFLKEQGITNIIIAVHYMADKIKSYFGDGRIWKVNITYSDEEVPLGTAGAIKNAEKYLNDTFLVLNGDSYSQIDLQKMLDFHKSKRSNFTIGLTVVEDASEYGTVVLNENKIAEFVEKKVNGRAMINSGIYLFEPKIFDYIESKKNVSLEKDVFPKLIKETVLYGYVYEGYFIDIGRPETYQKFKDDALTSLFIPKDYKLIDAMQKINRLGSDILLVVDSQKRLLGALSEKMINNFILKEKRLDVLVDNVMIKDPIVAKTSDDESKIREILLSGTHRLPIVDEQGIVRGVEFRIEKIKTENFPIIRGKTPLRISFAGGGTDLPYFFEKYGGAVTSATINKYCHGSIIKRADSKIVINSDLQEDVIFDSYSNLIYDGKFDLIKAIVNIMKPDFGFEMYLHNDIPPGRGLGSSASMAVLVVKLISSLQNVSYDDRKIAEIAHRAEREELKIKGGWQDQYAAVIGGFNFMEFGQNKSIVYPLRLKPEFVQEFRAHLTLCYVGGSHFSNDLHKTQEKIFASNEEAIAKSLNDLKALAIKIKDCLLTNETEVIGQLLHESWNNKKKLNLEITNPKIDFLYEIGLKNGAQGGRLLGAGGGGYILFFHLPNKRNSLVKALESAGGEVIDFNFEFEGAQTWPVKYKY